MSDPLKYLSNAQECLCRATYAANGEVRQRWLDLAESWLGMVPQDLRVLAEMFEKVSRDKNADQQFSKTRH
jgi:hypothetical protein